jgi:hypothetical protein
MSEEEEMMQELIEAGAMIVHGVDEFGEIIYKFNMEILSVFAPPLYEKIMEELDEDLMDLYKMGLVDIDYNENLEASFSISDKGKTYLTSGFIPEDEVE